MTIKWGDPIECNGVRPDWLRDDDTIRFENTPDTWLTNRADFFGWAVAQGRHDHCPRSIRLPADHPAYVALARGFTPWGGGESAPDDWDGGECLLRNTAPCPAGSITSWAHLPGGSDIIGYRKRKRNTTPLHEAPAPVEGVFIKRMTEAEWVGRYGLVATDKCSGGYILRDLGLVQDESRAERFTRETGHAVTEAVEAALNWKGE